MCQTRFQSTAGRPRAEHEASIKWMQLVPLHLQCAAPRVSIRLSCMNVEQIFLEPVSPALARTKTISLTGSGMRSARHLAWSDARSGWLGTRSASAGAHALDGLMLFLLSSMSHIFAWLRSQASGSVFLGPEAARRRPLSHFLILAMGYKHMSWKHWSPRGAL